MNYDDYLVSYKNNLEIYIYRLDKECAGEESYLWSQIVIFVWKKGLKLLSSSKVTSKKNKLVSFFLSCSKRR